MSRSIFKKRSLFFVFSFVFTLILMVNVWNFYLEDYLFDQFGVVTTAEVNLASRVSNTTFLANRTAEADLASREPNTTFLANRTAEADLASREPSTTFLVNRTTGADLGISFTSNPTIIEVGGLLSFQVNVENYGPSSADSVVTTIELPQNVVIYDSAIGNDWNCSQLNLVVTCTLPALATGSAAPITVGMLALAGDDVIMSQIAVESNTNDTNMSNNNTMALVGDTTVPRADLSIGMLDTPESVGTGDTLLYTLRTNNAGSHEASNVIVTNRLPAQATFVSATGSGWDCNHNHNTRTVTCNRSTLPVGAAADILITVTTPNEPVTLRNEASISSAIIDHNDSNNSTIEKTQMSASADLAITMTDTPDPVSNGNSVQYRLSVQNNGPSTASSIRVTHTLPAELSYLGASGEGWNCERNEQEVSCTRPSLSVGHAAKITINTNATNLGNQTQVNNFATVSSQIADPDSSNNRTTESTTFFGSDTNHIADLSINISDNTDSVDANTNFTYLLSVNNAGPVIADDLILTQQLPPDAVFVSVSAPDWSCNQPVTTLACTRTNLANGASSTISVTLTAPLTGTALSTEANISSAVLDLNQSNNQDSEQTTITRVADLSLLYANLSNSESTVSYTIKATNHGPSIANSVQLTQRWPDGLTYNDANGDGWVCNHDNTNQRLTCTRDTLLVGVTSELNVILNKQSNNPTGLLEADISSAIVDRNLSNNTQEQELTDTTPPSVSIADLSISLTSSSNPIAVGQTLSYNLNIENNGPQSAEQITVTQELPTDVSFQSASGIDWSCTPANNLVTCTRANLSVGSTTEISIQVTAPTSGGRIVSNASIQATTLDDNRSNNQTTESTTVPSASLYLPIVMQ